MPPIDLLKFRFSYWEDFLNRQHRVMYLQPPPVDLSSIKDLLTRSQNAVAKVIVDHAKAYMTEGKEPPAALAGPVMNFVDDISAGRVPVIRAGDYINITNFMKHKA